MGWEGLAPPNPLIPNVVEFESLSALFLVQGCKREPGIPKPELFLGFSYPVWSWYYLWLTDLLLE